MKLQEIISRRSGAQAALSIDSSGAIEAAGRSPLPGSEVVVIRDVWVMLGAQLELGSLQELACTDGTDASLYVVEKDGVTVAVVEGPAGEDLGTRAVAVRAAIEASR